MIDETDLYWILA